MNKKKFWFTLIELLISISIIWILIIILFRAYNTISQVTFRAQQEKNIQQEMIWIAQVLQNIADNHQIDFEKYNWSQNYENLFLSWKTERITITSTWNCKTDIEITTWFTQEERENPCKLVIVNQNDSITQINTPSESFISKPYFTIFPYKSNEEIINETDWFPFLNIRQPGFQTNFTIYTPLYEKWNWIKTSKILFQQFFNLQK